MNDDRKQHHGSQVRHHESRSEREAVEQTVERDTQKSGNSHLVNIAFPFLAGMNENKPFQHEYQQEAGQNRPTQILAEHFAGLGQHMKKNRPQEHSAAEAQQQGQRSLRKLAHERQKTSNERDENKRR